MKHYAQRRVPFRAVQWNGDQDTAAVLDLIAPHKARYAMETQQLVLLNGTRARVGAWIMSTAACVSVVDDDEFRAAFEAVDETGGPARPTAEEHEVAGKAFVQKLDALLIAGLRLSTGEHPSIFRDRDHLVRTLRDLLADHGYVVSLRERERMLEQVKKELWR